MLHCVFNLRLPSMHTRNGIAAPSVTTSDLKCMSLVHSGEISKLVLI